MKFILVLFSLTISLVSFSQKCFEHSFEDEATPENNYGYILKFDTGNFNTENPEKFSGTETYYSYDNPEEVISITEKSRTILQAAESEDEDNIFEIIFTVSDGDNTYEIKFHFTVTDLNGVILDIVKIEASNLEIRFSEVDC